MEKDVLYKLQQTQLEILLEVTEICNRNKLKYFLIGGTLLGAVRHKGFIPWDDDLDIAMPRKDYEEFIKICKTELSDKYFLHHYSTDDKYWLPFLKIRKNNTIFDEEMIEAIECHKGIFIDIFPLDNANKQTSIFQDIQVKICKSLTTIIMIKRKIKFNRKIKLSTKLMASLIGIIPIKTLNRIQTYIMSLNKHEEAKFYLNIGSNYNYIKQTIEKDRYLPATKLEFEKYYFSAPKDWDYILKRIYKDYMVLPDEKDRYTHKPKKIIF